MQYQTNHVILESFSTRSGETFSRVPACYTVYGCLFDDKPLALFFHGFSSNSELHTWWEKFNFNDIVRKYTIICINSLGSSYGSFGPESINPKTEKPFQNFFPTIDIQDTVNFTVETLKKLNIKKLDLVVGCSLGGMQALDLFLRYPTISKKNISAVGVPVPRMTKLVNLAQARLIDQSIQAWDGRDLETMLGLSRFFFRLSCTSEAALEILEKKQSEKREIKKLEALEAYFIEDNLKFQTQFSAYSNSLLLKMIANFTVEIPENLENGSSELLMISIQNDIFTPEEYVKKIFNDLVKKNYRCELRKFETDYGHEAWIIDGERFYDFIKENLNL